jgi:hypothetical protein
MIDENGLKTTFVSVFNNTPHSFQEIVVQTKFLSENIQRATRKAIPTASTSCNGRAKTDSHRFRPENDIIKMKSHANKCPK